MQDGIDAVTREAVNLLHEVRVLVVDGDAAQFPDRCGPLSRTRPVHIE
jgi:hypothetical protein